MRQPLRAGLVAALLTIPAAAYRRMLPFSYGVEAKAIQKAGVLAPLTFELYGDAACSSLIHAQTVAADDVFAIEAVKTVRPRGPKLRAQARLVERLTGVMSIAAVPKLYLKVTGQAIVPLGGDCQLQLESLEAASPCSPDSVKVGNVCVDKFEASVWKVPTANQALLTKIRQGTVTLADLTAAGASQLGCQPAPYGHVAFPSNFPDNGNWTAVAGSDPPTPGVYAVSIPGVLPTGCIT